MLSRHWVFGPVRHSQHRKSMVGKLISNRLVSLHWCLISIICVVSASSAEASRSFTTDCSANDRLKCSVEEGSCANNSRSDDFPGAPFDLRISWYLIAATPGNWDTYQLWVNVSWKPTHEKSINKTEGFELTITDKDTNQQQCFSFYLNQPEWEDKDRHTSTRFQFSTVDFFDYGHHYYIAVQSLPKPLNGPTPGKRDNMIGRDVTMPIHPEQFLLEQLNRTGYFEPSTSQLQAMTAHCAPQSENGRHEHGSGAHPHASKWVAAFRYVYIQPKARFIFVDFVAAPAQYCFEEYELRLLRNMHEIVDHVRIRRQDLNHEIHGNVSVAFGNHTFRNVTSGVYEIGVIPIDHSLADSRCLCPAFGRVCTCAQAVWPDVIMPDPPAMIDQPINPCDQLPPVKLPFDCPTNGSGILLETGTHEEDHSMTGSIVTLTCLLIGVLALIIAGIILLFVFYKRHKAKAAPRIYLLPGGGTTDFDLSSKAGDLEYSGTDMTPILHPVKVLIIYARDCPAHEAAVRALAEYLRSQCVCDTVIDSLCTSEIDANKFDWAYKSIAEADRVLLVNSYGAYIRYQAKLIADAGTDEKGDGRVQQSSTIVERADPSPYDDLFLLQLDLTTQCQQRDSNVSQKFISVKFAYTPAQFVLPHANPHIRYEIPAHIRSLVVDLHRLRNAVVDVTDEEVAPWASLPPRLRDVNKRDYELCAEGQRLKQCIEAMSGYVEENPDWFERLHVRRPLVAPTPFIPKTSPFKKPGSPIRTDGYVVAPPLLPEELESGLAPEMTSCPEPPTKAESTADSGFDDLEACSSAVGESSHSASGYVHSCRIPITDDDGLEDVSNTGLLDDNSKCGRSATNTDSYDSGIAVDYHTTSSDSGVVCNGSAYEYYSPEAHSQTRLLKNGFKKFDVRSPSNGKKLIDPAALETQRLIC